MNSNVLLFISTIYWSNIVIRNNGVYAEILEITYDEYRNLCDLQENAHLFNIFSEEQSMKYFNFNIRNPKKSMGTNPEICEWGTVENHSILETLCKNIAVKMSTEITGLMKTLKMYLSTDLDLIPYTTCYKKHVKNAEYGVNTSGLYCPPSIVNIEETKKIYLNGFFVGDGDQETNSVFVHRFDAADINNVHLLRYFYKTFVTPAIQISKDNYDIMVDQMVKMGFEFQDVSVAKKRFKGYHNPCVSLGLCGKRCDSPTLYESSEEEARNFCKYFATSKFLKLGKHHITVNSVKNTNISDYSDISGFVPYKYTNRKVNHKTVPVIGQKLEQQMVYCPIQLFTEIDEDRWYRQQGFFFSAGDDNENSAFLYQPQIESVDGQNKLEQIRVQYYITWDNLDHFQHNN